MSTIFLSDYLFYLLLLVLPWFLIRGELQLGLKTLLSISLASFVALSIKYFWPTLRPFQNGYSGSLMGQVPTDPAFPSMHTAIACALATTLFFSYRKSGVGLYVVALLIGVGRVLAHFHYPIDILGGVLVGTLAAWFIHLLKIQF